MVSPSMESFTQSQGRPLVKHPNQKVVVSLIQKREMKIVSPASVSSGEQQRHLSQSTRSGRRPLAKYLKNQMVDRFSLQKRKTMTMVRQSRWLAKIVMAYTLSGNLVQVCALPMHCPVVRRASLSR